MGATVVLHDDSRPFDVRTILETAARERVNMMTIVGDAYARPMIDELRTDDLRPLQPGRHRHRRRAHELRGEARADRAPAPRHDPRRLRRVRDRGDGVGRRRRRARAEAPALRARPPALGSLSADRTRFLDAGDDEVGWLARCDHVPLGYLDDEAATESTFPIVDGVRVAIPGDRARYAPDGQVVLLGRDSLVVNTGGEKVFVEEVEAVLKRHDDVVDALVVGRPSERFGQEVTAIVQLARVAPMPQPKALREWCSARLARYKAPRAFVFVERVERHPSGKANYQWARVTSERATEAL